MNSFNEEEFYKMISMVLKFGLFTFIIGALISFLLKLLQIDNYKTVLQYSTLILILTPFFRIFMLLIGFIRLKEKKYIIYSFLLLLIFILEFFL